MSYYKKEELIKIANKYGSLYNVFKFIDSNKYDVGLDAGDVSTYYDNLAKSKIESDISKITIKEKENIKNVYEEMINDYMISHKFTSPSKPTYEKVANATGVLTDSKLSNILNGKVDGTRQELYLICHVLNANEDKTNRFLLAAGQNTKVLSYEQAQRNFSLEDLTIREMLELRKTYEPPSLDFNPSPALEGYNEILSCIKNGYRKIK